MPSKAQKARNRCAKMKELLKPGDKVCYRRESEGIFRYFDEGQAVVYFEEKKKRAGRYVHHVYCEVKDLEFA